MLSDHAEAIAETYDLGMIIDMVIAARGRQGQVWQLVTDRGSFAVKDLIVRQTPADAAIDVSYQQAVLATGTVPLPRPVSTATGAVLMRVPGHQLRVYEWVDLQPTNVRLDPDLIGATLAAVHQVAHAPAKPLHGWYTDPVGALRWSELLAGARAAGAPFADDLAAEIPHLLRLEKLLEMPRTLQNCHRDLWADNMLPTSEGVCVIDWENCGLEDPSYEIPMVLVDFGAGEPDRTADLYRCYIDAGGPGRVDRYGSFSMVIAQFGHFWESAVASYSAPDATTEDKARSLDRVTESLSTPLRVAHLDAILDAIAGHGRSRRPSRPQI